MFKSQLEKGLYLACKAFITSYDLDSQIAHEPAPSHEEYEAAERAAIQSEPVGQKSGMGFPGGPPTSNGIPICQRHGKAMKDGKYGYFCTSKESDPRFSNKNGFCSNRG